jgi:hypothetical protein
MTCRKTTKTYKLRQATTTHHPGRTFHRDLGKCLDELPRLAQPFPPGDDLGRRVQDAVRRYTLQELPNWRDELERDWQLVRERVVRLRNTLAHGGPLMDDTVVTVHRFIEERALSTPTALSADSLESRLAELGITPGPLARQAAATLTGAARPRAGRRPLASVEPEDP